MIPKSCIIIYHDSVHGPPHELRNYLNRNKITDLLCIGHRNRYIIDNPIRFSYFEIYKNGKKTGYGKSPIENTLPEFFGYIVDFVTTFIWSLVHTKGKTDLFVGLGNLNALSGLMLKVLGLTDKTVYYVIDYSPERFKNKYINSFYLWLDKFCAKHCDFTWNYSEEMIKARGIVDKQMVVPHGVRNIINLNTEILKKKKNSMIYVGTLLEDQGIGIVVDAFIKAQKKNKDLEFIIIGQGFFKIKHHPNIKILGFIENPDEVEKYFEAASLGLACYDPNHKLKKYTDPGKVKWYLSQGIPVIITDIGKIAEKIRVNNIGYVVNYNSDDIAGEIVGYFKNRQHMEKMMENTVRYARNFRWEKIFDKAFAEIC